MSTPRTAAPPRHPAKFNDAILAEIARALPPEKFRLVLDPFAGTGRIHELPNDTVGIELEPEWAAMHPHTIEGDMFELLSREQPGTYDAIATSPCYGNRMADDHTPSVDDTSTRNTYRHALGRPLTHGTAANLQWGPEYRDFHERAWVECVRVLRDGGRFVLNVKDHIRDGAQQPVSGWHITTLARLGLRLLIATPVKSSGNRMGANGQARVEHEWVLVFVKDKAPAPTLFEAAPDAEAAKLVQGMARRIGELESQLERLRAEVAEHRENYLGACRTIAEMHAAAVGEVRGPIAGVVGDVAALREQLQAALAENVALKANADRREAEIAALRSGRIESVDEVHTYTQTRGRKTSKSAALAAAPKSGTTRRRVLTAIIAAPSTDEQIAMACGIAENSVRPRRKELLDGGFIVDSGQRRRTVAGNDAVVWAATDKGRSA